MEGDRNKAQSAAELGTDAAGDGDNEREKDEETGNMKDFTRVSAAYWRYGRCQSSCRPRVLGGLIVEILYIFPSI